MSSPSPDLKVLEERWRRRFLDTRLDLELARNRLKEIEIALRHDAIPSPDGGFERLQALRAERLALRKYRRILRLFTALVLSGRVPDEAEWLWEPSENDNGDEDSL
jgi:hypothetical protein